MENTPERMREARRIGWDDLTYVSSGDDQIEAEDIKKRWQEYTELYKKDLHDLDNHNGVITHLELDILECEVK